MSAIVLFLFLFSIPLWTMIISALFKRYYDKEEKTKREPYIPRVKEDEPHVSKSVTSVEKSKSYFFPGERVAKYKSMTLGREAESIENLASAVGMSYEFTLKELQELVAEGSFGPQAYIDYKDKTLVLRAPQGDASENFEEERTAPADAEPVSINFSDPVSEYKKKLYRMTPPKWLNSIGSILAMIGVFIMFTRSASSFPLAFFSVLGGIVSLEAYDKMKLRVSRIACYLDIIAGKDSIALSELSRRATVSWRKLLRDLEFMRRKGLLPDGAYVDVDAETLMLVPKTPPEPEKTAPEDDEEQYKAILRDMRRINDDIPDADMTRQISDMENITAKIFREVKEHPEKLPQIKSFMSYYLPTALKLLSYYAEFERKDIDGENISAARADIEGVLDKLVEGFRRQLDKLYEADALDIASDIDVLETMMERDGLSGDDSDSGQAIGGH